MVDYLVVAETARDAGESLGFIGNVEKAAVLAFGKAAEEADKISQYGVKVYKLQSHNPEQVFYAVTDVYATEKPRLIVGVSVKNVKDALSRLAGLYDLPMATEVWEAKIDDEGVTYKRGILSERAYSVERVEYPAIILINPRIAEAPEKSGGGSIIELNVKEAVAKRIDTRRKQLSGVKLEEAEIVVGVGRGFKSKDDLKLAFELADLLGGQVGGSRPIAADLKWLPEDAWIGISGKRISPKLYIAIGISGAPQHMSGVMGSKIIVAINKDKTAPIFKQADYGVVADLYKFVPVLIEKLKERKGKS